MTVSHRAAGETSLQQHMRTDTAQRADEGASQRQVLPKRMQHMERRIERNQREKQKKLVCSSTPIRKGHAQRMNYLRKT